MPEEIPLGKGSAEAGSAPDNELLELLKHDAENIRTFFSLTGPARKDYIVQMAEAEGIEIRAIRQAEADGLLAIRKAEAEGYRLIGEALASLHNAEHVLEFVRLHTLERVAKALADGKATKLFLPQDLGSLFSILGGFQGVLKKPS